jgi:hypothetical protein
MTQLAIAANTYEGRPPAVTGLWQCAQGRARLVLVAEPDGTITMAGVSPLPMWQTLAGVDTCWHCDQPAPYQDYGDTCPHCGEPLVPF